MPRLTRRTFCATLALAAMPIRGKAQATPQAVPSIEVRTLDGYREGDARGFVVADIGLAEVLAGSLLKIEALGLEFARSHDARDATDPLADRLQEYYEAVVSADPDFANATFRVADVSMDDLGDDRLARSIIVERDGSDVWAYAIILVRKRRWLQAIAGQGPRGAMLPTLAIAGDMIDRWPDGTIDAMLPTLDDVPPGMKEMDD